MSTSNGNPESKIHHLLWTGGWDSTFRLLQLLVDEQKQVQPYYIVAAQKSTGKEVDTMIRIRGAIFEKYPETKKLLKPVFFYEERAIEPDDEITDIYFRLRETKPIKRQYERFARFCNQMGIENMELCVLKKEIVEDPVAAKMIFNYFTFPLLNQTKKDLRTVSEKKGWDDIMEMTWFCRVPRNGRPCGFCGPCTDAYAEGFAYRLPLKARIIAFFQVPLRKWWRKNYRKQSGGILKYIPGFLDKKV